MGCWPVMKKEGGWEGVDGGPWRGGQAHQVLFGLLLEVLENSGMLKHAERWHPALQVVHTALIWTMQMEMDEWMAEF